MYRGRITFATPMLWTIGFISTFTIGGMTGVLMSVPAADFQLHNSLFLVAHFHNVIIGGVVFGYLAGLTYWFPKIFGFKLNETLGKWAFWCWIIGFYIAFMPLYALGLMGMTRRLSHYDVVAWHPYLIVAAIGSAIIACGIVFQIMQLVVSIKNRNKVGYKDTTGDPWDGRTLEWSIPSPAPFYNFAITPEVHTRDAYWELKQEIARGEKVPHKQYKDIHMPKNTGVGFIIAMFSAVFGFGMVWHIIWMIGLGLIGIVATVIARTFNMDIDYYLKADEVEKIEKAYK
jgi:cytochrome o ubiquinol oxidase subunit 1